MEEKLRSQKMAIKPVIKTESCPKILTMLFSCRTFSLTAREP